MTDVPAVLFDVDGTLLDSNYQHVTAWWQAFLAAGHRVSCFDIHRAIGLPSADLVQRLLGRADDGVVEGHAQRWQQVRDDVLPFHRAEQLQAVCAERGLPVVWTTSGSEGDVAAARDKLAGAGAVDAVVATREVPHGKPAPDIVRAGLDAVGATRAVLVGDTVYDVRAAAAAGVPAIALLGGGIGEKELRDAGAAAVYGNCSELLEYLDDSPIAALLS